MGKPKTALQCEYGENFICEGVRKFDEDYISESGTGGLDLRTMFYCTRIDYQGGEWYYNYLDHNSVIMTKAVSGEYGYGINKRAHSYLKLGYIPAVFLPSFLPQLNTAMIHVLENSRLPFIKLPPMAFGKNKLYGVNLIDAWVSKMDAAKFLECAPEQVRSKDLMRRLLSGDTYYE